MGADLGPDVGLCLSDRADVTLALKITCQFRDPAFVRYLRILELSWLLEFCLCSDTCPVHVG